MEKRTMLRRCNVFLLVLTMLLTVTIPCFAAGGTANSEAISESCNGVVRIFAYNSETGAAGTGSGFGVGKAGEETDIFITNWHVVTQNGAYPVGAMDVYIMLTNDAIKGDTDGVYFDASEMIRCEIVYAADKYPDVAILKAENKVPGRVALPLRSSRDVAIASKVYSIGYPAAADTTTISEADGSYYYYADVESVSTYSGTVSKMSAFELFGDTYCLEHGAHINNGNSGGPLVDENGNVVGINTYGITADEFANYSVYIDYAMDYLNQLGIAYDYMGGEELFPVIPAVVSAVLVLVLIIVLIVQKKKPDKQPVADTGLRVQYSDGSMMAGKRYVINGTLRFGRAEDCNIRYEDKASGISGHHCEILVNQGQAYIRDLNSTYGTFVNGNRIASNQQFPLTVGTEVCLGNMKESFQVVKSTKR